MLISNIKIRKMEDYYEGYKLKIAICFDVDKFLLENFEKHSSDIPNIIDNQENHRQFEILRYLMSCIK